MRTIAGPRSLKRAFRAPGLKGFEDSLPPAPADWLADDPPPQPMTVAAARLPMKPVAAHPRLACAGRHDVHAVDTRPARVDACAGCHRDEHTLACFDSPHHATLTAAQAGEAAAGSGVGCSDRHMPRIEDEAGGRPFTTRNQNACRRPNEKMIHAVCMDCHRLAFATDAQAGRRRSPAVFRHVPPFTSRASRGRRGV